MPRKGPYTKKRFYQLVKLYHPDIHSSHYEAAIHTTANSHTTKPRNSSSSSNGITHSIRLERYRLVIKANDILSNPEKRHLYDQYGIGWTERSQNEQLRAADRSWRDQPGNAAMNATWEDWEKWHAARDPSQKQPPGGFYMPNSVFAALVAMLCTIGALAQGRRAEVAGAHYVDVATQRHQDVSEEVRRSTSASAGMSQDERVERFLRDRENVIYSFSPGQYDSAEHTKPTR
jgi:curved DNA-binding protein CbpA